MATIKAYEELAVQENLAGFVSLVDVPVSEDGLHFDEHGSKSIGSLIADKVSGTDVFAGRGHPAKKCRSE